MVRERGSGSTPLVTSSLLKWAIEKDGVLKVAADSGVGKSAIHRFSKGIGEPTIETFEKLSAYFNVPVGMLKENKSVALEKVTRGKPADFGELEQDIEWMKDDIKARVDGITDYETILAVWLKVQPQDDDYVPNIHNAAISDKV